MSGVLPPPPTPPGYVELVKDVERLDAAAAQAKRDVARFYVLEERNAERFQSILLRIDGIETLVKDLVSDVRAVIAMKSKNGVKP